ncbi:hypothetical protein NOR_07213 [Metarhizium rileyi]|uniref:Heat-labile enterotoxin IIA, A chain n=1 Tax=Metarhizium rileyi (strain RCEF 4871) TaxID=1649241 RepID=A0A166YRU0_METRR|nr:hypothetical protein NOR_07213 [Metarhizium rileyi RCEF 4871]
MRVSIVCLALLGLGLASARPHVVARAPPTSPYKQKPPAQQIGDAIVKGIADWGPAANLKSPKPGPKFPIKNMIGGLPELQRLRPSTSDWRKDTLKGPRKKSPCRRDVACVSRTSAKGYGAKTGRYSRFRVPKGAGKAAAFMVVAPYAHDVLEAVKTWDNPIGHGVKWFDGAMASLQEAIGGPQRDDIYGNELKGKLIDGLKSISRAMFETDWDMRQRLNKEAAARERARRLEEEKENERVRGLNQLANICEKMDVERPEDPEAASRLEKSCGRLAAEVKRVREKEEQRARKKVKREPIYWFGKCKCNRNKLPPGGAKCANECRAFLSLIG